MNTKHFRRLVWNYYQKHGRDLPWRFPTIRLRKDKSLDPYRIFVSEVMLQQTQVSRVLKKYPQFLKAFPGFRALARASLRDVLRVWHGMGYNRRALYLKRAAEIIVRDYGRKVPNDPAVLARLPGVGKNTAGAIAAFAFNKPTVFIETNIRRAFIYHFFLKQSIRLPLGSRTPQYVGDDEILALVARTLVRKNPREWYWALMDYGTFLAKEVPHLNRRSMHYTKQSKFEGSRRQLRGVILQYIGDRGPQEVCVLARILKKPSAVVHKALRELCKDGLIHQHGNIFRVG